MLVVKNKKWGYPALMNQFFQNDLNGFWGSDLQSLTPSVNIKENDVAFIIEVATPGMNKEDIQLQLEKDILTVSAQKQTEKQENESHKFLKKEFSYHSFKRSFSVPESVDVSSIKAEYNNGVLSIALPKVQQHEPQASKTIVIS